MKEEKFMKEKNMSKVKVLTKLLECSVYDLADVFTLEEALALCGGDKKFEAEFKKKYDSAKKNEKTAYERICECIDKDKFSATAIRRIYNYGYARAVRVVDILEEEGLVEKDEKSLLPVPVSKRKLKEFLKDFDDTTWVRKN